MQGVVISNTSRHRRHTGSTTDQHPHGWKQSLQPWHQRLYQWTSFHRMQDLQDMLRLGISRRWWKLFGKYNNKGMIPNKFSFSQLLNKCASLQAHEEGRHIHTQIIQRGYESDVFVGSSLIDMYAKCGNIVDAQRAFSNMAVCDVVTWNSMILGHVKCGQRLKALELSQQMQREGVQQDTVIWMHALVQQHFSKEGMFMNRFSEGVVSLISL